MTGRVVLGEPGVTAADDVAVDDEAVARGQRDLAPEAVGVVPQVDVSRDERLVAEPEGLVAGDLVPHLHREGADAVVVVDADGALHDEGDLVVAVGNDDRQVVVDVTHSEHAGTQLGDVVGRRATAAAATTGSPVHATGAVVGVAGTHMPIAVVVVALVAEVDLAVVAGEEEDEVHIGVSGKGSFMAFAILGT